MRVMMKFLPLALLLLLSACAGKTWQPPVDGEEKLFRVDGSGVSKSAFMEMAAQADYIFVGEQHNNACHHLSQAELLGWSIEAGLNPVLGLEMLPAEEWDKLMLFDGDQKEESDDKNPRKRPPIKAFPAISNWMEIWGYNFAIYEPVIRVAYEQGLPMRGLNLPKRVVAAVAKAGLPGVDEEDTHLMPPQVLPMAEGQAVAIAPMRAMHAQRPQGRGAMHFEEVMRLWDSGMGWNAFRLHTSAGRAVFMILGIGHMQGGWAVPRAVKHFDPEAKMLTIAPWSDNVLPEPGFADLFYYCAPQGTLNKPVEDNT